jgi:hypothetical protein
MRSKFTSPEMRKFIAETRICVVIFFQLSWSVLVIHKIEGVAVQ